MSPWAMTTWHRSGGGGKGGRFEAVHNGKLSTPNPGHAADEGPTVVVDRIVVLVVEDDGAVVVVEGCPVAWVDVEVGVDPSSPPVTAMTSSVPRNVAATPPKIVTTMVPLFAWSHRRSMLRSVGDLAQRCPECPFRGRRAPASGRQLPLVAPFSGVPGRLSVLSRSRPLPTRAVR